MHSTESQSPAHPAAAADARATRKSSGFACMECGHKFRTVKAAERAAFGDNGCPRCGGSDIDLTGEVAS